MVIANSQEHRNRAGKRYSPEIIILDLRVAELLQGQGTTIAEVVKQRGITGQALHRWRKEYGGTRADRGK